MTRTVVSPEEDAEFVRAVLAEDDLSVVVRSHIHVENRLLKFIELTCPASKHLKKMELDFSQQVQLALALGLPEDCGPPLHAIGNMRNAFAHSLAAKLSKDRVDAFYKAFSARDKLVVQATYDRLQQAATEPKLPALRKLEPKGQFVFLATSLRSMVQAHINLAQCVASEA
jgi:hypothetical protein